MTEGLPIVTRRDMLLENCILCADGVYRRDFLRAALEEVLVCSRCGCTVDRWLTKREVLQLRSLCAPEDKDDE